MLLHRWWAPAALRVDNAIERAAGAKIETPLVPWGQGHVLLFDVAPLLFTILG